MADALIFEFDGLSRKDYDAVNAALGIDHETGAGEWPDGLIFHSGSEKPGGLVVFEVWESKAHQEAFMNGRLGKALQEGGATAPPARLEWLDLISHVSPGA
jgi:hypothetical protein